MPKVRMAKSLTQGGTESITQPPTDSTREGTVGEAPAMASPDANERAAAATPARPSPRTRPGGGASVVTSDSVATAISILWDECTMNLRSRAFCHARRPGCFEDV